MDSRNPICKVIFQSIKKRDSVKIRYMDQEILDRESVIQQTIRFVKTELSRAEGGHDWWHVYRVWELSKTIARTEEADLFIVELGALLHDIADSKFHSGDEEIGPRLAGDFLDSLKVDKKIIIHIEKIIANISFRGGNEKQRFRSPELDVIQDADRLDALGAIGIARTFNYGGYKGRELFNPEIEPNLHLTKEEYKNSRAPTLNHFYEKLLLLKDRMNTPTGRSLAEHRHRYLEGFLEEFHKEWDGQR